ncbi:MAG TPA: aminotransferase class V-fold PLP-dependent enzyme [Ignavibacteria bacterium]|nr:aminotransferase class V-fold PLP-dependent enzyme [Ignavibacteria bacterium]
MNKVYFTPGPTELYPDVRSYIEKALNDNVCSINHRSKEFMDIYKETADNLKQLMNIPDNYNIFFLSSATECMDRIIQNTVEKSSFHFVNGAFAERFYQTSVELNKDAEKTEAEYGKSFNFNNIRIDNDPELICITQNETSTGVAVDPAEIYKIKKKHPESIMAVDIVTSTPFVDLEYNEIDCAFFSVQKGFGLPAGLGVLIANDRCMEKARNLKAKKVSTGSYHNFISLYENAEKFQTTETPNVLGIYLLGKVCESLNKYGVDKMRNETLKKSEMLYKFFDGHPFLKPFVSIPSDRSKTIIEVNAGLRQAEIKNKLADAGIIVGSGYGKLKDTHIRIANFPMHATEDVKKIIEILS